MATVTLSQGGKTLASAAVTTSSSKPLFDGRASQLTALASTSTTAQTQTPKIWTALLFNENAVSLVADKRFGTVYQVKTGVGITNPWNVLPPYKTSAELSVVNTLTDGVELFYSDSLSFGSSFNVTDDFGEFMQLGYPSVTSPPLALCVNQGGIGLEVNTGGAVQQPSGYWRTAHFENPYQNAWAHIGDYLSKTVDIVIAAKWTATTSGYRTVYVRVGGIAGTWAKVYDQQSVVTMQWKQGQPVNYGVVDKIGFYQGWASASGGNVPSNVHTRRGLMRHSSLADAQASLG